MSISLFFGHKLTVDSVGPFIGGGTALLALLSGTWFSPAQTGFLHDVAQYLPSYWLVQAPSRAARAYRDDTGRA